MTNVIQTATGAISLDSLLTLLDTIPFEIDFVDATDHFAWFNHADNRIFKRTAADLGQAVTECHPGATRDKVAQILTDFHAGTRDHVEFWVPINQRMIAITYYALRDKDGQYLGCFEFTGDVTHLQSLRGKKTLANSQDLR